MLRVDHKLRPSCADILDLEHVRERCNRLGISLENSFKNLNELNVQRG